MIDKAQQRSIWLYSAVVVAVASLMYLPFLGGLHLFDWDEINFAEISREMLLTGEYARVYIDFQPFWEKPPFFFWLQAMAMQLLGVGEYAARLPNALTGIVTLLLLLHIGRRLGGLRLGIIWAAVYGCSVLPFLYFKSGIIDPVFNLFIFLGLYYFIRAYWRSTGGEYLPERKSDWHLFALAGLFIGFAMLTKGQVAYLLTVLTLGVYWVYQRARLYIRIPHFVWFTAFAGLVTLAWFGWETSRNGPFFVSEFIRYQWRLFSTPDAGHKGFPGFHPVVLLIGCFPASIFAIRAFKRGFNQADEPAYRLDFRRWMIFLFWTVVILFSIVQSKIVHYSSLAYFPLTYLAAESIDRAWGKKQPAGIWLRAGLWAVGGIYIVVTLLLPWLGKSVASWQHLVQDPFAKGNLEASVVWTGAEMIAGLALLVVLIIATRLLAAARWRTGMTVLLGGMLVFLWLCLGLFVGKIETYSQRAAIEFFEQVADENAYATTFGYKSYAHLFYGAKKQGLNPSAYQKDWLIEGAVDRPVYIATKIHKAEELSSRPGFVRLYEKNGFVFFRRDP
jgi:4-amino-4-deoxy-L-arabinose transferase-like glycosyltransferase